MNRVQGGRRREQIAQAFRETPRPVEALVKEFFVSETTVRRALREDGICTLSYSSEIAQWKRNGLKGQIPKLYGRHDLETVAKILRHPVAIVREATLECIREGLIKGPFGAPDSK